MKIALCLSGQIGGISKAFSNQQKNIIENNNCDVYCYTSDAVSQKDNTFVNLSPSSPVFEYLKAGVGWRKHYNNYGIIYNIKEDDIINIFETIYDGKLINYDIEKEYIYNVNYDTDMTKWEWMKLRQLNKLKKCNELMKSSGKQYDIVMRARFDIAFAFKIDVEKIIADYGGLNNIKDKIFIFGGFGCTPPMVFMDEFFCDGFAFGTPEVMDIFCSLADKEEPYPFHTKYKETWEKWGDNIEHQFKRHMIHHNIEICYISQSRADYMLVR